jgi:hypothetical protein
MSLDVTLYIPVDTGGDEPYAACLYEANITHNLGEMARAAGIYEATWRPNEHGFKTAGDIIPILEAGIDLMESDPVKFEALNSPNGWGKYEHFLPWLEKYLEACKKHPKALIDT